MYHIYSWVFMHTYILMYVLRYIYILKYIHIYIYIIPRRCCPRTSRIPGSCSPRKWRTLGAAPPNPCILDRYASRTPRTLGAAPSEPLHPGGLRLADIPLEQTGGDSFFCTLFSFTFLSTYAAHSFFLTFWRFTGPGRYLIFSREILHRMHSESCLGTPWGPSYEHICKNIYFCKGCIGWQPWLKRALKTISIRFRNPTWFTNFWTSRFELCLCNGSYMLTSSGIWCLNINCAGRGASRLDNAREWLGRDLLLEPCETGSQVWATNRGTIGWSVNFSSTSAVSGYHWFKLHWLVWS